MKLDRKLPVTMTLSSGIATTSGNSNAQNIPAKVAEVSTELLRSFPHSKRVGNYLLGRTLGEGSFAKVKEGLHTLTGEKVAIKVIDKKKARKDPYVRRNLRREGKLLQMVRHKNIVQLFEVMETENSYYLVTELCKGGDLMDRICNRRRLEEKETRRYIRQIISAIDHLHKAGVIHRDLKVENLLLDERKDIKIIDFGLSNVVRMNEVAEVGSTARAYCVTQCGSPAYAAPELLGNNKYGPQVDVWSIGVNMYAMLTGNLPFTVEPFNIKTLHSKMLKGDVNPLPDHLSNACKDLMKRLLTADPEKRITLKEAMRHPWIVEGRNSQLEPAPFPNKLNADALQHNIVKFMADDLGFNLGDVIRMVSSNTASSATATYHLLLQKLTRYNADRHSSGQPSVTDATWLAANRKDKVTLAQTEPVAAAAAVGHKRPAGNAAVQKTTKGPAVTTDQPRILELKQSPRKFAQKTAPPRQAIRATQVTGWTPRQGDSGDDSLVTHQDVRPDASGRHEDVLILRLAASQTDGNTAKPTNVSEKPPHTTGAQPVHRDRGHELSRVTSIDVKTSYVTTIDVVKAEQSTDGAMTNRNGHVELPTLVRNFPDSNTGKDSDDSAASDTASRTGGRLSNGRAEPHNGRLSPTPEVEVAHPETMNCVKPKAAGPMHFAIVPTGPCVVTGRSDQVGTPTTEHSVGDAVGTPQPVVAQGRGWRGVKHTAESRVSVKRPPMRRKLTLDLGNYDRYARSNSSGRTLPTVQGSGGDPKYPNARRLLDFVYPLGSRDATTKNKLLTNRQVAGRTSKAASDGGKHVGGQERRAGNARVTGLARHSIDSTPVSHHVVAVTEMTQVAPLDGRSSPSSAGRSALTPLSYTSKDSKVTLPTISHFTIGAKSHPEVEQE